jgi:cyclohexa-1,5-dienecarbonyl-CoA hydratase
MSDYKFFDVSVADSVATVTMNKPPLNVLCNPMMAEFNALLETVLAGDGASAIVLAASGKAFSAGVDVSDHTAELVGDMIRLFHGIFRKLASTDAVTIAAVQGAALGGGCELACFCDIVLASDRAKFGQPEVQVGVFPPVAACVLPLRVGTGKAVEISAIGATIGAVEAHRIGLVDQVFASDEFASKVGEYVAQFGKLSRPVVRLAKRATMLVAKEQIMAHLDRTEELYLSELMALRDAHEGIEAFMEKRAPKWCHA